MVLTLIHVNAAPRAAIRAHTVGRLQPPNALLVEEVFAAERTNGAQINHIPGQLVVARLTRKDIDLRVIPAADHLKLCCATDLAREPHTSRAHDAAVGEQRNLLANVGLIRRRLLRLLQPAIPAAILEAVVLQKAFARLIASRAIERMIEQQILHRRFLRRLHLLAVRNNHHPIGHRRLATGNQLRLHRNRAVRLLLPNLDQTHPATGHDAQIRMPTIMRNLIAQALSSLNAIQLLLSTKLERLVVYVNSWHESIDLTPHAKQAKSKTIQAIFIRRWTQMNTDKN